MALDVGDVRIGIAVSDLMGIIANPLETYTRKGDIQNDARYIIDLANSKDVSLFVACRWDLTGRKTNKRVKRGSLSAF